MTLKLWLPRKSCEEGCTQQDWMRLGKGTLASSWDGFLTCLPLKSCAMNGIGYIVDLLVAS